MGAPITGMIVLGFVQTLLALSTISPTLERAVQRAGEPGGRHQRHSLHRLAVRVDRDDEGREGRRRTSTRATRSSRLVAMGYSVFALYASGKDAVMGGMLVLGITYIVWGFIATAFLGSGGSAVPASPAAKAAYARVQEENNMQVNEPSRRDQAAVARAARHRARPVVLLALAALPASAQTLDRISETGRIRLGYLADARPFSFRNDAGTPDGYAVALCQRDRRRAQDAAGAADTCSSIGSPVTADTRIRELRARQHRSAVLADQRNAGQAQAMPRSRFRSSPAATAPSCARTPCRRCAARSADQASSEPVWRGSPAAKVLEDTTFAVVSGTTSADLARSERQLAAGRCARSRRSRTIARGCRQVHGSQGRRVLRRPRRSCSARSIAAARDELVVLDRLFTHEPSALALARGDDDFRLAVDRALSQLYASKNSRISTRSGSATSTTRRARSSCGTRLPSEPRHSERFSTPSQE